MNSTLQKVYPIKRKQFNRAFTLIELLVVIAIIGILSGLIITTMSGATESARIAKLKVYSNSVRDTLGANLVSEWKFDEGSGSVINDSWGTNNGTWTGPLAPNTSSNFRPQLECISGQCLSFDGVDDYIDYGNQLNMTSNDFSISAWVKITKDYIPTGWDSSIINKQGFGTPRTGYSLYLTGSAATNKSRYGFVIGTSASYKEIQSDISFNDGQWHLITAIADRDTAISMYIDSIFHKSTPVNDPNYNLTNNASLAVSKGSDAYHKGSIDDVRIYNAAISATQIQQNYLAGLNKLLANNAISRGEYDQRLSEFNKSIAQTN